MKPYSQSWLYGFKDIERKYKYDRYTRQTIAYYNIPCAFDIETTSTYSQNNKIAFPYEYTIAIKDNACYCRTMQDFQKIIYDIQLWFMTSPTQRIVIYVHNLGFEFQFIRKYFKWLKVFSVDERKPIVAVTVNGIEFRDSYILSAYSLAKTADNLTSHDIKKLVGDLDYNLVRHSQTPMTDNELAYCENDVLIITAYIDEQISQYGDITKIPMTNTGRVRKFVRQNCLRNQKAKGGKSIGKRYRELMNECSLTLESYFYCKQAFQGGYVHASNLYSRKLLKDVHSIDFNSSYPYVMCSEKYPMGRPNELTRQMFNVKHFMNGNKDREYCYLLKIRLEKVHSKLTFESYLSESKCNGENVLASNGRIYSADYLETTITDIDLDVIMATYEYKAIQILGGYYFYKQYLPRTFIDSIMTLYERKNLLKGVEGKEVEYLVSKQMLNSCYGMSVTDIIRIENQYENDNWIELKPDMQKMQETLAKDNNSKNRFLYYPWGVFVTSYARYNLWQGIIAFGNDYIYSDTDSIKYLNKEAHDDYIRDYNKKCLEKLSAMCNFRKLDISRCSPNGKTLGVFDYEGKSDYFKTLGAKRYMTYANGKYKLTVAGLSKQNGMDYIRRLAHDNVEKAFELFDDNLSIPADKTGKQTHTYIDDKMQGTITDYLGNKQEISVESAIHLENAPFELSISNRYAEFLNAFMQGYLLKGGYV